MSESYAFSPTVDMSGYIPVAERAKSVQSHPAPASPKQSRLDGSIIGAKKESDVSGRVFFGLNRKRQGGRVFHRVISGVKRARARGERLRFLTLTTPVGYDRSRLSKDMNILRKRVEHVEFSRDGFHRFHMELVKVTTSEGNGVIHAIFKAGQVRRFSQVKLNCLPHLRKCKGGSPVKASSELGFIPFPWLKQTWAEIVGGNPENQHVYIEFVRGNDKKVAGYLCQYVSGQDKLERLSWTRGWVFPGFVREWNRKYAPMLAELYHAGIPSNDQREAVFRDWDKYICSFD